MRTCTLILTPLTGIHIGTGVSIGPGEYTIAESQQKNPVFLRIDEDRVVESLQGDDKRIFTKYLDKDDYLALRRFFSEQTSRNFSLALYGGQTTTGFKSFFKENIRNDNKLLVMEAYRPIGSKRPFIPGSSVKGAIRTAILDEAIHNRPGGTGDFSFIASQVRGRDNRFQEAVLRYSNAKDDPFRTLRVSDGRVDGKKVLLVGPLVNVSTQGMRLGMEPKGMHMAAEVISGKLLGGDGEARLVLSFHQDLPRTDNFKGIRAFKAEELIKACNNFYLAAWANEYARFYEDDQGSRTVAGELNELIKDIRPEKNEFLLRIGRFSQVECVTVNDLRRPWNKRGYGQSRTVFDRDGVLVPLGWTKARIEED